MPLHVFCVSVCVCFVLFVFGLLQCALKRLPRYVLAEKMHLPVDCEEFKIIMEETPHDDLWDDKIPQEAMYKKAGLKRYKLDVADTWETVGFEEKKSEGFISNQDVHTGALSILGVSAGSSAVKIEIAEFAMLQVELKIVKAAATVANTLLSNLKAVQHQLALSANELCLGLMFDGVWWEGVCK